MKMVKRYTCNGVTIVTERTTAYRGTLITFDGACYYVSFQGGEEMPFDTRREACAYIDACRYGRTVALMARG